MRTYLVRDIITDECVGYFSLKAGLISLNEIEVEVEDTETGEHTTVKEFDTLPGVELANFVVNSSYISAYPYLKGVGHVIFTEFHNSYDRASCSVCRSQNGLYLCIAL